MTDEILLRVSIYVGQFSWDGKGNRQKAKNDCFQIYLYGTRNMPIHLIHNKIN